MSDLILVFDVGGHGARAGLVDDRTGTLQRQADTAVSAQSPNGCSARALTDLLRRAAGALGAFETRRVVIAAPGPVIDGRVARLPTLFPGSDEPVDLAAIGTELWPDAEIWTCNDLTAAGFAFVAQGHRDFCVLTCGSGIGGKIFVDGRPLLGAAGMGGEIGHWRVPGLPAIPCDCGGAGHLGALASGRGAVRLAQHVARSDPERFRASTLSRVALDSHSLAAAFRDGDAWAQGVIDMSAGAIGAALALIHLATAVERFFVTGGFAGALGPEFGARIAAHAQASAWDTGLRWAEAVEIMSSEVEWGLIGAGELTRHMPSHLQRRSTCD